MDFGTVARATDWIIDQAPSSSDSRAWGKHPQAADASFTVTAEVVLALNSVKRLVRNVPDPQRTKIDSAIDRARDYLRGFVARPTAENDVSNYALVAMAELESAPSPDSDLIQHCLDGLTSLHTRTAAGAGWRPEPSATSPTTFSACLAVLALQDMLEFARLPDKILLTAGVMQDAALRALVGEGVRAQGGGLRDFESRDSEEVGDPAVTAAAVVALTRSRSGGHFQADEARLKDLIDFLTRQRTSQRKWLWTLQRTDYQVFYRPWLLRALGGNLDLLGPDQLAFFYREATQLSGLRFEPGSPGLPAVDCQLIDPSSLVNWRLAIDTRESQPVWLTAYGLLGVASVGPDWVDLCGVTRLVEHHQRLGPATPVPLLAIRDDRRGPRVLLSVRVAWGPSLWLVVAIFVVAGVSFSVLRAIGDHELRGPAAVSSTLAFFAAGLLATWGIDPGRTAVGKRLVEAALFAAAAVGVIAYVFAYVFP